jgi:pyrroline-5-carboxylate reductase
MNILLIGGGFMGEALLAGILNSEYRTELDITVAEIDEKRQDFLRNTYPITVTTSAQEALQNSPPDVIILSIKPQQFSETVQPFKGLISSNTLVISVAAGIPLTTITEKTGQPLSVRIMPNLPAAVMEGAAAIYFSPQFTPAQKNTVINLIKTSCPTLVEVGSDDEVDLCTAINGSGPAYIFQIIEAMINAATLRGMSEPDAKALVLQTVLGAAKYAQGSDSSIQDLRSAVTSPGGTTAAGLAILQGADVSITFDSAIAAAYARAIELRA